MDFAEQLKIWVPVISLVLSVVALLFTRRSWYETNRPIVTAEIVTNSGGSMATAFDLAIHNTGNRPAVNIQLIASESDINQTLEASAPSHLVAEIHRCFSERAIIPLLQQGQSSRNGFGATSHLPNANALKMHSKLPICIKYLDITGKRYTTNQILIVKDTTWFAGSGWERSNA